MTKTLCVISALFCLALYGCLATGKPMTWKEKGIQFSKYTSFEIRPVENKAGKTFEQDIPSILTSHLIDQFEEKSLKVVDNSSDSTGVLFVESDLLVYVTGSAFKRWLAPGAGKTQCTLKTRLIDKSTNKIVAEIIAAKEISSGGLYSIGAEEQILKDAAEDIANETSKIVSGKDSR